MKVCVFANLYYLMKQENLLQLTFSDVGSSENVPASEQVRLLQRLNI